MMVLLFVYLTISAAIILTLQIIAINHIMGSCSCRKRDNYYRTKCVDAGDDSCGEKCRHYK